jgi:hypothetical protein
MNRLLFVSIFIAINPCVATVTAPKFKHWFPTYGFIFENFLQNNCSAEYHVYLRGERNNSNIDWNAGAGYKNQLVQPVVECILQSCSELMKADMGSCSVLLGLAPSILAILGPSVEEISLLSIVGGRRFYALLLAAGSPAVFPVRSFENRDPLRALAEFKGHSRYFELSFPAELVIATIEYILTLAAVANVLTLTHQLASQSILAIAPETTYIPWLWVFIGVLLHIIGSFTFHLHVSVTRERTRLSLATWFRPLYTPWFEHGTVRTETQMETYLFIFMSWFMSVGTVLHVIFGTLMFSALLFVAVEDGLMIIGRFMASVVLCRIILLFEIVRLREVFNSGRQEREERIEM